MDISIIISIIHHFLVCVLLMNGILLWLQRRVSLKPRICLMIFSLVSASILAYGLYGTYVNGVPTTNSVLPISTLKCGFLELLLLYLYPIGVINPSQLSVKRVLILLSPWFIICLIHIVVPINFRNLSSFSQMLEYVGEFNVWFRLMILFVCIVPYTLLLLYIPYRWRSNCADCKWIYNYVLGVQGMGLLFCVSILTGSVGASSVHLLYSTIFCMYIVYHEFFIRLSPESHSTPIVRSEYAVVSADTDLSNPLWNRLTVLMNEKELWREQITLGDLANHLHTNRTTLSVLINQNGYSGYTEFINGHRIAAFVEKVKTDQSINIQELFYDVGFRSKSTAFRNFRSYMGCTPSEYIQQVILKR